MADGFTLIVPKEMIDRLDVADKKIGQLATKSEEASKRIVAAFNEMSTKGVDKFIESLNKAHQELNKLASTKVNLDNMFSTSKSISEITKLIDALGKLTKAQNQANAKDNTSSKTDPEAARVNKLYSERISLMKQLAKIQQRGEKYGTISMAESSQISNIRSLILERENEIETIRKKANVSKQTNDALIRGEANYTLAVAEETRKIQSIRDKNDKDRIAKERETQRKLAEEQSKNRQQQYNRYVSTYEGAMRTSEKAHTYAQEQQAIKNLEEARANLSKKDVDYANKLENINQAIERHKKSLQSAKMTMEEKAKQAERDAEREVKASKRKEDAARRAAKVEEDKKHTSSVDSAIKYSKEAKSINEQIKALQYLKQVRDNLDRSNPKAYHDAMTRLTAEINRQKASVDALTRSKQNMSNTHRSLINTGEQLTRRLALMFSVSAIQGYINKLATVRAEFELHQRSLQALLQDKEAADEIWGQTVQLALKSPFRVKELVSYTKQLAAYRIESDKLYQTNKMLADVSAGLGVDMQRLILAFGQVRAAEYLRGTELRQFTEAGIPMLDELAKYFTEVRGYAVSTANVFEMISKRMVEFADVEEVFKRITSAGGAFYKMQEKQSETLYGQISNLHDAIDLMLNDIGKSNEGILKGSVSVARSLVDNWDEVLLRIIPLISYFGIMKLATSVYAIGMKKAAAATVALGNSQKAARIRGQLLVAQMTTQELKLMGLSTWQARWQIACARTAIAVRGLGAALKSIGWFALISVAMEAVFRLTEAQRELAQLKSDLANSDKEVRGEMEQSIGTYIRYAEQATDVTSSLKDREEAMEAIKRQFKEILPDYMTEIEYIERMNDGYAAVKSAMEAYYDSLAKKKKLAIVDENYGKQIDERVNDLMNSFKGSDVMNVDKNVSKSFFEHFGVDEVGVRSAIESILLEIQKGNIKVEEFASEFKNKLVKMYELDPNEAAELNSYLTGELPSNGNMLVMPDITTDAAITNLKDLTSKLKEYVGVRQSIEGMSNTDASKRELANLEKHRKAYDAMIEVYDKVKEAYNRYNKAISRERTTGVKMSQADENLIKNEISNYYKELKIPVSADFDFRGIADNAYTLESEFDRIGTSISSNFVNTILPTVNQTSGAIYTMSSNAQILGQQPVPTFISGISTQQPQIQSSADSIAGMTEQVGILGTLGQIPFFTQLPTAINDTTELGYGMQTLTEQVVGFSDSLLQTPEQIMGDEIRNDLLKTFELPVHLLDFLKISSTDTFANIKQDVTSNYERIVEGHMRAKKMMQENPLMSHHLIFQTTGITKEEFENYDKLVEFMKQYAKKWGFSLGKATKPKKPKTPKKTKKEKAKDYTDERTRLLVELYKEYEKLNDIMSDNTAAKRVSAAYAATFKSVLGNLKAFKKGISSVDFTSIDGLIKALEKLLATTKKGTEQYRELQKTIAEFDAERETKRIEKQNDERERRITLLKEEYRIYKELLEAGTEKSMIKPLFGLEAISIEELRKQIIAAYGNFEDLEEQMIHMGETMDNLVSGNVSILTHSIPTKAQLLDSGWIESLDEDGLPTKKYSVRSEKNTVKEIVVTPVLPDGTILTEKELDAYVSKNLNNKKDIISSDTKKIVIATEVDGQFDLWSQQLSDFVKLHRVVSDIGEKQREQYAEDIADVNKLDQEAQLERMKKYLKYLKQAQSERVKIKVEEIQMLSEIEDTYKVNEAIAKSRHIGITDQQWKAFESLGIGIEEVTDQQWLSIGLTESQISKIKDYIIVLNEARKLAMSGVKEETSKKLQAEEWNVFKNSAMYEQLFSDIENLGTKSIDALLARLETMKKTLKDLPPEVYKEIQSAITQLKDVKSARNPFATWSSAFKQYNSRGLNIGNEWGTNGILRNEDDVQMYLDRMNEEKNNTNAQIELLEQIKKAEGDINLLKQAGVDASKIDQELLKLSTSQLDSKILSLKGQLKVQNDNSDLAKEELDKYTSMRKEMAAAEQGVNNWKDAIVGVVDGVDALLESLGVAEDDSSRLWIGMAKGCIEAVASMVLLTLQAHIMGVAMNSALGIIGWIATGLQAVAMLLSGIFGAHDKKLQKEIEKIEEDVEKLSKALEKLEDALEKNYAFESLRSDMQEINSNIDEQIAKRRRQIYLEKKKKETDKDQIKDWEDEIEELEEERAEAHREMIESLGGVDDYRSATREFVDAWVDAFNETGNGLQGLTENFREFFKNIILEQAVMKGAGKIMEPLLDEINKSLDDYEIQGHEEQKIKALSEQKMKELDEFLNGLFGENGMWNEWIDDKGQSLSGLQEGIQGVTEETAQIIEAYLNSIRFYIAQDNQNLADLRNFFIGSEEDTNPMLSQLRIIAQQTTAIYDLLDSVSRSGHSQGGKGIKVFID